MKSAQCDSRFEQRYVGVATTEAVTDFSEDAVPARTTKVRADGARPRTTAVCARVGVNTNSRRAAPEAVHVCLLDCE